MKITPEKSTLFNIAFLVLPALFLSYLIVITSCSKPVEKPLGFAFYNVENLFDTIDDPTIRDSSHLPTSRIPWNTERYQHKLDNLTKVMSAIVANAFPNLFGLCEVENIDVLIDLINHPRLKEANYSILHKNSPDERGIDVALLYQSKIYSPVETKYLPIVLPFDPENKTRDILYSKGVAYGQDTLHIFINHWVSRWGGQEKTEPARRFIGGFLKKITDSILSAQPNANIILAGDLNDNPDDKSVQEGLMARVPGKSIDASSLYNLSYNKFKQGQGTLYYKSWDMFDQIIVSGALIKGNNGIMLNSTDQEIIKHDWMLYEPKEGPKRPSRTASRNYYGGFSDHLPVYIRMTTK